LFIDISNVTRRKQPLAALRERTHVSKIELDISIRRYQPHGESISLKSRRPFPLRVIIEESVSAASFERKKKDRPKARKEITVFSAAGSGERRDEIDGID